VQPDAPVRRPSLVGVYLRRALQASARGSSGVSGCQRGRAAPAACGVPALVQVSATADVLSRPRVVVGASDSEDGASSGGLAALSGRAQVRPIAPWRRPVA